MKKVNDFIASLEKEPGKYWLNGTHILAAECQNSVVTFSVFYWLISKASHHDLTLELYGAKWDCESEKLIVLFRIDY